ncbi:hypothetical protein [Nonomuraea sp. NPDC001699]
MLVAQLLDGVGAQRCLDTLGQGGEQGVLVLETPVERAHRLARFRGDIGDLDFGVALARREPSRGNLELDRAAPELGRVRCGHEGHPS